MDVEELDFKKLYFNVTSDVKNLLELQSKNVEKFEENLYSIGIYDGIAIVYGLLTQTKPEFYKEKLNG